MKQMEKQLRVLSQQELNDYKAHLLYLVRSANIKKDIERKNKLIEIINKINLEISK